MAYPVWAIAIHEVLCLNSASIDISDYSSSYLWRDLLMVRVRERHSIIIAQYQLLGGLGLVSRGQTVFWPRETSLGWRSV